MNDVLKGALITTAGFAVLVTVIAYWLDRFLTGGGNLGAGDPSTVKSCGREKR